MMRIIAPVGGQRAVTLSYVCLHCPPFPIEDYIWWVSTRHGQKQCKMWCAACGGQYDWRKPNRVLVTQDCTDRSEAKVFRAHAESCQSLHKSARGGIVEVLGGVKDGAKQVTVGQTRGGEHRRLGGELGGAPFWEVKRVMGSVSVDVALRRTGAGGERTVSTAADGSTF